MALTLLEVTSSTGARVQVSTSSIEVIEVIIQAKDTNTGSVYVGDSTVTSTNGLKLGAPETSRTPDFVSFGTGGIPSNTINLNSLYIDPVNSNEGTNVFYR